MQTMIQSLVYIDIVTLVLAIAVLLPSVMLLRNYIQTSSIDFLIFSLIFIFLSCHFFSVSLQPIAIAESNFLMFYTLQYFTFLFWNAISLVIFFHAYFIKFSKEKIQVPYFFIFYFLFLAIFGMLMQFMLFLENDELMSFQAKLLYDLFHVLSRLYRLLSSLMLMYVYFTVIPINPTARMNRVIFYGKILAILIFMHVIGILIDGFLDLEYSNLIFGLETFEINIWDPFWESSWYIIITSLNFAIVIVCFILALRYPETMLISQVQILRAIEIYKTIRTGPEPRKLDSDRLVRYIQSIPDNLFDKLEPIE